MFFAKPRLVGALKHNQSWKESSELSGRLAVYLFFLIAMVLPALLRRILLRAFTRRRLVSGGRPTMLVLRLGVFW
jgi:hypothetical protein